MKLVQRLVHGPLVGNVLWDMYCFYQHYTHILQEVHYGSRDGGARPFETLESWLTSPTESAAVFA